MDDIPKCLLWVVMVIKTQKDFPGDLDGKESACNVGELGLIPGLGRPPGEGTGNPLQYSCLEKFMDRGAWRATVHGVAKSRTRLKQVSMQARTFTSFTATSMSQWFPSLINGLTGVRTGTVWVTEEKCTARRQAMGDSFNYQSHRILSGRICSQGC